MTEAPTPVLFISGAGLPPWIWDDVRARLTERPTHVAPRPVGKHASLADHASAALDEVPGGRFVVVAHSAGGTVATKILEQQPERVAGVLGVAAIVPPPGGSFVGAMPFPNRLFLSLAMRVLGTRPPEKVLRKSLAAGLPDPVADDIVRGFTPESQRYYRDPVGTAAVPSHTGYVCTTSDRDFPIAMQRSFAQRLGVDRADELATGHLPMLQEPDSLARIVREFVGSTSS